MSDLDAAALELLRSWCAKDRTKRVFCILFYQGEYEVELHDGARLSNGKRVVGDAEDALVVGHGIAISLTDAATTAVLAAEYMEDERRN